MGDTTDGLATCLPINHCSLSSRLSQKYSSRRQSPKELFSASSNHEPPAAAPLPTISLRLLFCVKSNGPLSFSAYTSCDKRNWRKLNTSGLKSTSRSCVLLRLDTESRRSDQGGKNVNAYFDSSKSPLTLRYSFKVLSPIHNSPSIRKLCLAGISTSAPGTLTVITPFSNLKLAPMTGNTCSMGIR